MVLKLKTAQFAIRTRAARLPSPTVLPDRLFAAARTLLAREATGTAFRLIGIGASPLVPLAGADRGDLADSTPRASPPRRPRSTRCASATARRRSDGKGMAWRGAAPLPPAPSREGRGSSARGYASGGAAAIGISRASG